jgi:hypothetical protein
MQERNFETMAVRYGEAEAPTTVAWSAVLEGMLSHRSVRAYLATPLPPGALEALVATA